MRSRTAGAGQVIIEARQIADDEVDIFVADDGVGMSEETQRRALDPFFTTRRNEGGTGLGLHIIFNLVTQQLGGRLTFESKPAGAPGFASPFRGWRPAKRADRRKQWICPRTD